MCPKLCDVGPSNLYVKLPQVRVDGIEKNVFSKTLLHLLGGDANTAGSDSNVGLTTIKNVQSLLYVGAIGAQPHGVHQKAS